MGSDSIVRGVHCYDPDYMGVSYMIFPPKTRDQKPWEYVCVPTLSWPPYDCMQMMSVGVPRKRFFIDRLELPHGLRTTFHWLKSISSEDSYKMGLEEHHEDMESLWSFINAFTDGASRFYFLIPPLTPKVLSGVSLIAVEVDGKLRVHVDFVVSGEKSRGAMAYRKNVHLLAGYKDDNTGETIYTSREGWSVRVTDGGLRLEGYIKDDNSSANTSGVIAPEVCEAEFRRGLANYIFAEWLMPFTFGSLVRIGAGKCNFQFELFTYDSSRNNGEHIRGIRCIDPDDNRCAYLFVPMENSKDNPEDFSCELTDIWPTSDCVGNLMREQVQPNKILSYFAYLAHEITSMEEDAPMIVTRISALEWLRAATGVPDAHFRDGQWEAIDGVLHNRRQLVVQRTGWGKSMIYFIASKFLREKGRGMTLLISPLIALMRNQVAAAERVGVRCYTINSTNPNEWKGIREKILSDAADILIVSPERLANDSFREKILEPITDRIALLVIDEAHCVSDWGHDFRPDYKKISRLLAHLPPTVPVLATTATATNRVVADIEAQLGGAVAVQRGSLVRKSLYLQNIRLRSKEARLAWLADTLRSRIPGSGIVYALTIRDAEIVARWLRQNGISAYAYSSNSLPPADIAPELRDELKGSAEWTNAEDSGARTGIYRRFLEDLLLANRVRALVATSALSMGFDKPDLAFVIHYQRPKSVVDYYQQVGRAGRGVDSAYGVLLNGEEDDEIADYFIRCAFPPEDMVRQVLDAVAAAPRGLSIVELDRKLNIRHKQIEQVLRFVMSENPQPIVKEGAKYRATPFVNSYRLPVDTIRRLTEIRHAERRNMDEYVNASGCLMKFLCDTLESPSEDTSCDRCANCRPDLRLPDAVDPSLEQAAAILLRKSHVPISPRVRWVDAESAITRFELVRNSVIPPELRMAEGRALSLYGVGEWGRLVRRGKYQTQPPRFDDQLVEACAQMLREWTPQKSPVWIVPIPSRRNNSLVGDFAERLARRLGMPCWRGLAKTIETPMQKEMESSAFQQNNVINAFAVKGQPPQGGCFLVDDMVDSRWTLTVASAVLREAGVEFVVPLALADSSYDGE